MVAHPAGGGAGGGGTSSGGATNVNKAIQQLAQRYCGDCKNSFDELSKIIQVLRTGDCSWSSG